VDYCCWAFSVSKNIMKAHGEKAGIWKTHIIISLLLVSWGSKAHKPQWATTNIRQHRTPKHDLLHSHEIIAYLLCKSCLLITHSKEVFFYIIWTCPLHLDSLNLDHCAVSSCDIFLTK
jgi:hypothetical protein